MPDQKMVFQCSVGSCDCRIRPVLDTPTAIHKGPETYAENEDGRNARDAGRKEEALQHFKQSCAISKDVNCLFGSAEIEFERRDFAQAEHDYAATLMLTHDPATALNACNKAAQSLLELGNPTGAERAVA
jgi:hypothetical protein